MNKNERLDDHQKVQELAALAQGGTLSEDERLELERHLEICPSCEQASQEYALINSAGMNFLSTVYGYSHDSKMWNAGSVRSKLLARIRRAEQSGVAGTAARVLRMPPRWFSWAWFAHRPAAQWALASCVLLAVAHGAYRLGGRIATPVHQSALSPAAEVQPPSFEKRAANDLNSSLNAQLLRLQNEASSGRQEIVRLREALRVAEARSAALATARNDGDAQLRQVSLQRDELASQLHDAEQSYQVLQAELTALRAEHERVTLRTASLESKVDELTASARDKERKLQDDEQYLASDRDIRELMGARRLYIADVFDVDSGSRTRKPFGRVFYTESKSLIFYAFDLDRQPGVKNASAFQVWGQRDAESGAENRAMNLGILYMDSESNRRWVLRLDDPKQLADIDAVFVTVEPRGGSQKPTGKPFLYALLRREANHP